ncbi:hypothetical protein PHSC3_001382 [Chlamydiales bacterium STE3]|nr:hypothetical protein PHSC3_001382 [Chlamydiales bacterium STE3]
MIIKCILRLLLLTSFFLGNLEGVYIERYNTTDNGGITFTGNTLGLSKATNQNNPGSVDSIGAYITTDLSKKVGNYPPGTTLNYLQNGSSAVLDLPSESTVLYAELIWSGSYGFPTTPSPPPAPPSDVSVILIDPHNISHLVSADPTTSQNATTPSYPNSGNYVRSQNVTSIVQAGGAGTYTGSQIIGTVAASDNSHNAAGWALAVVYSNPQMITNNMTIFVGCEQASYSLNLPAKVSGFCVPGSGTIRGRLFVSAIEGDANNKGGADTLLFGPTSTLTSANAQQGSNNPINNFFGSQINTLLPLSTDPETGKLLALGSSLIDTRGSFGTANADPFTYTLHSGDRQGFDITSVDVSSALSYDQEQAYVLGTTNGDDYTINGLGIQIQVDAPILSAFKTVNSVVTENVDVGDIVNFTITIHNDGTSTAYGVVVKDILQAGLSYVPGSFTVNGTSAPDPDLAKGFSIGDFASSVPTISLEFKARVDSYPAVGTTYYNAADIDYHFVPCLTTTPLTLTAKTNQVRINLPEISLPVANPDVGITNANTQLTGFSVLTNDSGNSLTVTQYDQKSIEGGLLTIIPSTGFYTYTPPNGFSGVDTFNYTITDAYDHTATSTLTITVLPIAMDDTGTVAANTQLKSPSVLSNDIGSQLTIDTYDNTSTQNGMIAMQSDGTYTYTPPLDFSGIDNFTYTAIDSNGKTTTATVTITVLPKAQNDLGITNANTPLYGTSVLTNDIGQKLTLVSYDRTSSKGGTEVMQPDGTYTYTPPTAFSGLDTFKYIVKDKNNVESTATVAITVLPIAVNNSETTVANTPLKGSNLLANDIGTGLSVFSYNTESVAGGSITTNPDGTYVYTPPLNFSGSDLFRYTLVDSNGNTSEAMVTITVLPVANNDSGITKVNTPLNGPPVLKNAIGTGLTIYNYDSTSVQNGSVNMNTQTGIYTYNPPIDFTGVDEFNYTAVDVKGNNAKAMVTITVLPAAVDDTGKTEENTLLEGPSVFSNDAGSDLTISRYDAVSLKGGTVTMNTQTGTYTYTPPHGFLGEDSFTYTIEGSAGDPSTATVFITVTPVPPPTQFVGKLDKCKFLNKTIYSLQATWSGSPSPEVVLYRIYANGEVISEIPASGPLKFKTGLKAKHRASEFTIVAVNKNNAESIQMRMNCE